MSCAHCGGSGFCQYSAVWYDKDKSIVYMYCEKCGCGPYRKYSWIIDPAPSSSDSANLRVPVCGACGGRGY